MKRALFGLIILLLFLCEPLAAQGVTNGHAQYTPQSPNVAALEKFGNYPISYHTGTVGISAPLYQIPLDGNITLNVELNYHSGGIRVEEVSGWVGAGWALQAGGCISRQVRGAPDENGFYEYAKLYPGQTFPEPISESTNRSLLNQLAFRSRDGEPDLFTYNFNGRSGKFFVDNRANLCMMPQADIKIARHPLDNIDSGHWELIDEAGYLYKFSVREQASLNSDFLPSAWWLTEIRSPQGVLLATFTYSDSQAQSGNPTRNTITYAQNVFESVEEPIQSYLGPNSSSARALFYAKDISKITIPGKGYVKFTSGTSRPDQNWKMLSKVEYFNEDDNNQSQNSYNFTYSPNGIHPLLAEINKTDGAQTIRYRKFTYNTELPLGFSYSQDLWGYYNGKTNTSLYPDILEFRSINGITYSPGNRDVTIQAIAGSIKEVYYPTGGKTVFEFENNKVLDDSGGISIVKTNGRHYHEGYGVQTTTFSNEAEIISNVTMALTIHPAGLYQIEIELKKTSSGQQFAYTFSMSELSQYTPTYNTDGSISYTIPKLFTLPVGDYKWTTRITEDLGGSPLQPRPIDIHFEYNREVANPTREKPVGGLRIARITNYDENYNVTDVTRYSYLTPAGISSGVGAPDPVFVSTYSVCLPLTNFLGKIYKLYELNETDLNQYTGNAVQYAFVTEEKLENNVPKLRTEYTYTTQTFDRTVDPYSLEAPYIWTGVPYSLNEYEGGLLLSSTDYRYTGSIFTPARRVTNTWQVVTTGVTRFRSLAVTPYLTVRESYNAGQGRECRIGYYDIVAARVLLTKTETEEMPDSTPTVKSTVDRYYTNTAYTQPTRMVETDSQGRSQETTYRYCYDDNSSIHNDMKTKNLINQPIETIRKVAGAQVSRQQVVNGYVNNNSFIRPVTIKTQTNSSLKFAQVDFHNYDSYGNPVYITSNGTDPVIYLWSYTGKYPVAEIRNATFSQAEAAVKQVFGVTNINALAALKSPSTSLLQSLRNNSNLSNAHVTVYSYDLSGNMLSTTAPNGLTTWYTYDKFGRLKEIYYNEGGSKRILEAYDYKYKY